VPRALDAIKREVFEIRSGFNMRFARHREFLTRGNLRSSTGGAVLRNGSAQIHRSKWFPDVASASRGLLDRKKAEIFLRACARGRSSLPEEDLRTGRRRSRNWWAVTYINSRADGPLITRGGMVFKLF